MSKMSGFAKFMAKHGSKILGGVSVGFGIAAVGLAIKATPKAERNLIEARQEKGEKLTKMEEIKAVAPAYVPTVLMLGGSIAAMVGSQKIATAQMTALATSCEAASKAYNELYSATKEVVGEKTMTAIADKRAENVMNDTPITDQNTVVIGSGESLCFDTFSGRYFYCNVDRVRKAINNANHELLTGDGYYALDDLYYDIGLAPCNASDGMGWNVSEGLIEEAFTSKIQKETDKPALVLSFLNPPQSEYSKIWR